PIMGGSFGALINKQALADTPKECLNWYVFFVANCLAVSGGLHGFNTSNISGILAMTDFIKTFRLTSYSATEYSNISGWVTSVIVLGYSSNGSINQVIGGRAIQGYTSGVGTVVGPLFLAEISPRAIRGVLGALFSLVSLLVSGSIMAVFSIFPKILIGNGGSPSLSRCFLVQSSFYSLAKTTNDSSVSRGRLDEIKSSAEEEIETARSTSWAGIIRNMKSDDSLIRRFVLVIIIQIGFNFSGGNSITYYQSNILKSLGLTSKTNSYLFSGVYGLMKVSAVIVYAVFLSERLGRRAMLMIGGVGCMCCVLFLTVYLSLHPTASTSGSTGSYAYAAVASICLFAIFYGLSWAPVAFGVAAETMSNHMRSKAMTVFISVQYLVNFLLTRFFPNIVQSTGARGPFLIFTVASGAILLFCYFAMPETKGQSLESMANLFGSHIWLNGLRYSIFRDTFAHLQAPLIDKDFRSYTDDAASSPKK
ncbi:MAG: hypothetical protein CYPHOPRED_004840, partial [Cyphobasidiales sp. Tagirdzhanova-0007]